jgi:hypothetical protein
MCKFIMNINVINIVTSMWLRCSLLRTAALAIFQFAILVGGPDNILVGGPDNILVGRLVDGPEAVSGPDDGGPVAVGRSVAEVPGGPVGPAKVGPAVGPAEVVGPVGPAEVGLVGPHPQSPVGLAEQSPVGPAKLLDGRLRDANIVAVALINTVADGGVAHVLADSQGGGEALLLLLLHLLHLLHSKAEAGQQ